MKDSKKITVVFVTIFLVYALYYWQGRIFPSLRNPLNFLQKNNAEEQTELSSDSPNLENVKIVVVNEQDAVVDVIEKSSPAVVSIVKKEVYFDPFRGPFRSEDSIATGFLIKDKNGIVLTNKHVVDSEAATYSVVLGEGKAQYDVEKIFRDPINDFAILKIALPDNVQELPGLEFGNSDNLKVGQTVIAIGNALGEFGNSATKGIVSGLGRAIFARAGIFGAPEALEDVIQTDAALNPGNSGGPLLDLAGKVVGINVAISQGAENIGFSIPINTLLPVIEDFYTTGKISRPFLGVEYVQITKDLAEERALPIGAFVRSVVPGSPASKAGIQPGDIILKIGGVRLNDSENTLSRVIAGQDVGVEIDIVIDRNGKEETLKATLKDLEE